MPGPSSATAFLELLQQSQLLGEEVIGKYREAIANSTTLPEDLARKLVSEGQLTPFQANHLLRGRYKNFFIGKYKVLSPIGSGGASHVYLCEHSTMKHRVAVKLINPKEVQDEASLNRVKREARAAATVNHPNVVRAYDFDQAEEKYYYLVMEYVDGVSLYDLVTKIGPLSVEQASHYITQAATGLQHIAELGIVHRDIKPNNLMLDRTGVIRILDLGLARFREKADDALTAMYKDRTVHGTADYLSPEQALQSPQLDSRADIYSLGATFYYLLSGQPPFDNLTIAQKLLHHQFKDIPPIPDVPDELFDVIRTMMAKKPEERYQSPDELIEALQAWSSLPLPPPDEDYFETSLSTSAPPSSSRRAPSSSRVSPSRIENASRTPSTIPPPDRKLPLVLSGIIVVLLIVIVYLLIR
jgi:eukaryotic-like serine/threonine-protein kinase